MRKEIIIFALLWNMSIGISERRKRACNKPITTASGSAAPKNFCKGGLIFEDNFDSLNLHKWQHDITLYGGGNHEFQWYTSNSNNSFTKDGILFLRPSLTADFLGGAGKLYSDTIDLGSSCTNNRENGCKRKGTSKDILNPIRSAQLYTKHSFAFKYGRVEIRARMPTGDWLWPALWLMPHDSKYGGWPRSGEIDIAESRGNKNLQHSGKNIGTDRVSSTLHWGPNYTHDAFNKTTYVQYKPGSGYDMAFSIYELMWTPGYIKFSINGKALGTVDPKTNFWDFGEFEKQGLHNNLWANGGKMAPFDQEFYLLMNLAVGGTSGFFPDSATNYPHAKPWKNNAPHAMTDFWNGRNNWLPTWELRKNGGYDASLKVDYVRVWAI